MDPRRILLRLKEYTEEMTPDELELMYGETLGQIILDTRNSTPR